MSPSDFGQVDTILECLDFAWSATISTHKSVCAAPLELVARVLIPSADRYLKPYNPKRVKNRLISVQYI